jgi:hypothetical protein
MDPMYCENLANTYGLHEGRRLLRAERDPQPGEVALGDAQDAGEGPAAPEPRPHPGQAGAEVRGQGFARGRRSDDPAGLTRPARGHPSGHAATTSPRSTRAGARGRATSGSRARPPASPRRGRPDGLGLGPLPRRSFGRSDADWAGVSAVRSGPVRDGAGATPLLAGAAAARIPRCHPGVGSQTGGRRGSEEETEEAGEDSDVGGG